MLNSQSVVALLMLRDCLLHTTMIVCSRLTVDQLPRENAECPRATLVYLRSYTRGLRTVSMIRNTITCKCDQWRAEAGRTVRRPRASTLGSSKEPVFVKRCR